MLALHPHATCCSGSPEFAYGSHANCCGNVVPVEYSRLYSVWRPFEAKIRVIHNGPARGLVRWSTQSLDTPTGAESSSSRRQR